MIDIFYTSIDKLLCSNSKNSSLICYSDHFVITNAFQKLVKQDIFPLLEIRIPLIEKFKKSVFDQGYPNGNSKQCKFKRIA